MANNYCENKSNKPVITKYDPSKNYVVQMVESLASIDYPNENHIYVIESTGEKYIFYNGAFSKFASTPLEPLIVEYSATYTSSDKGAFRYYYSDNVTFDKTYDEVKQAVEEGRPVYLKHGDVIELMDVEIQESHIYFSDSFASRSQNNTQFETGGHSIVMPATGTYGTSTTVRIKAHNLVPDSTLSSTSTRPVQNRVVKQAIDAIQTMTPLVVTAITSNISPAQHNYYNIWISSDVIYSEFFTSIKNALENGRPIIILHDDMYKNCIAVQRDSSTIAMTVCDVSYDANSRIPQYITETFTIESDNTGSYVKTSLSVNEVVTFTYGEPSTADMDFATAVALHTSGKPLTAMVSMNGMTAVSKSYIYNGSSIFIFALNVGMISGTVQWSSSGVVITINQ